MSSAMRMTRPYTRFAGYTGRGYIAGCVYAAVKGGFKWRTSDG